MVKTKLLRTGYKSGIIPLLLLFIYSSTSFSQNSNWELKIDKKDIKVFCRWMPNQGNQRVREIKATFTVEAQADELISILQNGEKAAEWMVGAKTFNILAAHGPESWHAYTEFDLPWPLKKQDLVALYKLEKKEDHITKVKVQAKPDYHPEYPKIERMQHFEACWTFQTLGSGKTQVTYCAFTYRKPSAPRWISDPVVQNSLWKTMSGFRELAEE